MIKSKQDRIKDRRKLVKETFSQMRDEKNLVSAIVARLSRMHSVTEITIYNDLKELGLTNGKPRKKEA